MKLNPVTYRRFLTPRVILSNAKAKNIRRFSMVHQNTLRETIRELQDSAVSLALRARKDLWQE